MIVQNKVAIGPSTLQEDDTPSYLSTEPVSRCASRGCKIAGTEMGSGTTLVAYCQLKAEWTTNADINSPGIKQNANLVASPLWYGIELPDGTRGYISEVYIAADYRGGLELPGC
ncbi:hypothetical protein [Actinokineospora sp. NPDC004072]